MKINIRSLTQTLNIGKGIFREWHKLQSSDSVDHANQPGNHSSQQNKPTVASSTPQSGQGTNYPGDYTGPVNFVYSPNLDGDPDPGEVVWAWVPFEEDYSQGKDRPILIIGSEGNYLLGLMLTSKDRNNTHHKDSRYLDIGSGDWDREGRPSEVKLDRVIRVDPSVMRREGSIMNQRTFNAIEKAYRSQ